MPFTEEEKLTIIAEGEKTGVKTVCAKYDISVPDLPGVALQGQRNQLHRDLS